MKLFVYGSLRQGSPQFATMLAGNILNSEQAFVKGKLYTLKDKFFPALINGKRLIVGEVFDIADDFDFTVIDEYENYKANDKTNNYYNKELVKVYDAQGAYKFDAFAYTYNLLRPDSEKELGYLIESNDYLKPNS